jgi:hypothetical protein
LFLSAGWSDMSKHTVSFIYVMSNTAVPGIVKIGWTGKLAE